MSLNAFVAGAADVGLLELGLGEGPDAAGPDRVVTESVTSISAIVVARPTLVLSICIAPARSLFHSCIDIASCALGQNHTFFRNLKYHNARHHMHRSAPCTDICPHHSMGHSLNSIGCGIMEWYARTRAALWPGYAYPLSMGLRYHVSNAATGLRSTTAKDQRICLRVGVDLGSQS